VQQLIIARELLKDTHRAVDIPADIRAAIARTNASEQ